MAPSHKAETVNQILTNHKKLFNISLITFTAARTQWAISWPRMLLPCQSAGEGKADKKWKEVFPFIAYHGEAELVAEELNFLDKSKRFEFSYELLKSMVTWQTQQISLGLNVS